MKGPSRTMAAAVAAVLMLAAAGCGDDDEPGTAAAGQTTAAASDAAARSDDGGGDAVPSTGVAPAPASELTACLEKAGFTVSTDTSAPEELREQLGITDQVTIVGAQDAGEPGAGAITYYSDEGKAAEAHKAELGQQQAKSVIGRKTTAVYSYTGGSFSEAGRTILGCL